MVLCWIALPIFAILSIFSLRYRKLTVDALDCLFRNITLRKCSSGLDDKIRGDVTGTFLKFSPSLAKVFYKNYKIISWIMFISLLLSFYFGVAGVHNYLKYGNCNGPNSNEYCIFNSIENLTVTLASQYSINKTEIEKCINSSKHTGEECINHCEEQ